MKNETYEYDYNLDFSKISYLEEVYQSPFDEFYYVADFESCKEPRGVIRDVSEAKIFPDEDLDEDGELLVTFAPLSVYDDEEELTLIWKRS